MKEKMKTETMTRKTIPLTTPIKGIVFLVIVSVFSCLQGQAGAACGVAQ